MRKRTRRCSSVSARRPRSRRDAATTSETHWARKYQSTATKVPKCNATSKASPGSGQRNSHGANARCAELLTGRNSDSPCRTPSTSACVMVITGAGERPDRRCRVSPTERVFIERFVVAHDVVEGEALRPVGRSESTHRCPSRLVAEKLDGCRRHLIDAADGAQDSGLAVAHDLREPARLAADHRHAGRERLECAQTEGLARAGQEKKIGACEEWRDRFDLTEEKNAVGDAQL